ncbi:uncharacterized protein [Montipora capricornis]|uniref:uncharacterized protein isoform X4 n=1 Tax=Montipora capricornis TaxID=246305 RepID=UPI0035F19A7F
MRSSLERLIENGAFISNYKITKISQDKEGASGMAARKNLRNHIEQILNSTQQFQTQHRSFLLKNLASLRKEKDYWMHFMEEDEWHKQTICEVETAWKRRSQADQPSVFPCREELAERSQELAEKPPPHGRRLRRTHTDPTDLLWVFRRRATLLAHERNAGHGSPRRKYGISTPCYPEIDSVCKEIPESTNECLDEKTTAGSCRENNLPIQYPSMETTEETSSGNDDKHITTIPRWTTLSVKHNEPRRKISCPAYRIGQRESVVAAHSKQRRASVAAPRRMGRRGSEAPALTVIARRRTSQSLAYPVGLRRKTSRTTLGPDHNRSIQAKAKHEMLANLVLPAFVEEISRPRIERRNTFTFQASAMRCKKDERRYQVAKEILDTEKKYLSCLRTLKEVFEKPVRETNLIHPKEMNVLFPEELGQILESHTLFMKDLEARLQNWKFQGIVGDIFTKLSSSYHVDVLRIYSNYVNNFPKAIGVINKALRGSQKFRKFLQNCSSNTECEGLDLPAFLLTPIQRLPRYVLLLRQLSKHTDPGHPDSFHIESALETMKQMINILNDSIQNSCKLASNSHMRRSYRRKYLRKKGKEFHKGKFNSLESESRISLGASSVSTLPAESGGQEIINLRDGTPEREHDNLEERGSPTLALFCEPEGNSRSLASSTADVETHCERDIQEEFATIKEEDYEDSEDSKSPGQNVFRMAADSFIKNLQRRSKKWRRSTEEPLKNDGEINLKEDSHDKNMIGKCQENLRDENGNVQCDSKDITKGYGTPPCSPARRRSMRKNAVAFPLKPRPVSLGLPTNFQLREEQNVLRDKVLSDPSLTKEKSIENSDVWIRRQDLPPMRRRTSGLSVCSRNSSVFSDSSPLSGSKRSLSHISQESLADSGVSETPGSSPSNTLRTRSRARSTPENGEKLSHSLTDVTSPSGETQRKLSQLSRRSWGDWISAEMENTPEKRRVSVRSEGRASDDVEVKNKRKFKDVMKQLFSSKKKLVPTSSSYIADSPTETSSLNTGPSKNIRPEIREKMSTV